MSTPVIPIPDQLIVRLKADPQTVLANAFLENQQRLEWVVELRLDRRLSGRIDVDDVLQESYLQALQRVQHYWADPSVSLFVWIRSIACQTLVDVHRRHLGYQVRDAAREISIDGSSYWETTSICLAEALAGNTTSPSGAVVRDEMAKQVETALAELDAIDREVLVMRHFEDLTNAEVAQVLNLRPNAASMRYTRALVRLKEVLDTTQETTETNESASI